MYYIYVLYICIIYLYYISVLLSIFYFTIKIKSRLRIKSIKKAHNKLAFINVQKVKFNEKITLYYWKFKKEEESSSRTVSRRLVNAILEKIDNVELEELNLYEEHIPQLKGCYFESRSAIVSVEARSSLTKEEQREVAKIEQLCDQFKSADIYVLAVPMWSLSFPAPVKEYIDCIIQTGKPSHLKIISPMVL